MVQYFKIYGQKRTGTNYVASLITQSFMNVNVYMNVGGWKHGPIIEFPNSYNLLNTVDKKTAQGINKNKTIELFKNKEIYFIVTIKNPYMWMYSISQFENKKLNESYIISKIKEWNTNYLNYKTYIEQNKAYLIKYEDIIQDQKKIFQDMKNRFGIEIYNADIDIVYKLLPNNDNDLGKTSKKQFDKTKYIQPNISNYLSKDSIRIINKTIDTSLLNFYNYSIQKVE